MKVDKTQIVAITAVILFILYALRQVSGYTPILQEPPKRETVGTWLSKVISQNSTK